ncbi:SigE family RNA polymerase sigma factor [Streptomyces sp. NBC_00233]|uniref:SigE family RNA polymerase sigma factor n=1 Tax=Streptomyces sp. NBC_00233 TaxID=2975686 RepID=UPI00225A4708|nr:SigE family RNA polymerase sigma factor [Streptomyces sp. NBC_00233]MCX5231444.1 SigE family RNA polymerase sigma factor [Streptomyces sp. NBC_00233]MCX5233008.1 SigE family RNA polymerase sigma factor [Streptomyces sp. NBC_00233]
MRTGNDHSGDADFTAFVAARWARLTRTAYMLTGDFHEAEDLVQTTLGKVYPRWRRLRADEVDGYVYQSLVNNNRSRYRKRRVVHLLTPFLPDTPHPTEDPRIADQRDALMEALAALPVRQRAVVVLRYWDDLSVEETAHALGCSTGTVKSQASRAMAKLRSHPALAARSLTPLGEIS